MTFETAKTLCGYNTVNEQGGLVVPQPFTTANLIQPLNKFKDYDFGLKV